EHARLPVSSLAGEAAGGDLAKRGQRREVRLEPANRLDAPELDEHVQRPVRVGLDREARAHRADRREQLVPVLVLAPARDQLAHPPERDPGARALELDGDGAEAGLESDGVAIESAAEDERATEHGVPGERKLATGCEDAQPRIAAAIGGGGERALGEGALSRPARPRPRGDSPGRPEPPAAVSP